VDARQHQNSLRMTGEVGGRPLGKQCMSGVDPIAIMRQHAATSPNQAISAGRCTR
jgi:hypothetical protein